MKKVFISVPMRGRTDEQIEESIVKMFKTAEAMTGEKLELVPSFFKGRIIETDGDRINALGDAIKMMALADYFVYPWPAWEYRGVDIETDVANSYHIKAVQIPLEFACPDLGDENGRYVNPPALTETEAVSE